MIFGNRDRLLDRTFCTSNIDKVGETESPTVNHTDTKASFTTASGHRDFSCLDVELLAVGLEADQVPLLDTACPAGISDDVGIGQQAVFGTVGKHFIPPGFANPHDGAAVATGTVCPFPQNPGDAKDASRVKPLTLLRISRVNPLTLTSLSGRASSPFSMSHASWAANWNEPRPVST